MNNYCKSQKKKLNEKLTEEQEKEMVNILRNAKTTYIWLRILEDDYDIKLILTEELIKIDELLEKVL